EVPEKLDGLNNALRKIQEECEEEGKILETIDARRRKLEREVEEQKLNLENFKKRKQEARRNEEFLALKREIERTEEKINQLEDKLLEVYIEKEEQEKISNQVNESLKEKEKEIEEQSKSLNKSLQESTEELIIKEDERLRIAARLQDEGLLRRYNRLIESRGSGIAILEEPICSECHSTLPPQLFAEVRKCDKIHTCHSCGRILIYKWID
ncbi:hypothetical protein KAW48_09855, partial [candidate division WOR-3 bacterium]|nr:hypothetical protein [candidate division WOR-3 bacterium]